jgi:hypothetical protein
MKTFIEFTRRMDENAGLLIKLTQAMGMGVPGHFPSNARSMFFNKRDIPKIIEKAKLLGFEPEFSDTGMPESDYIAVSVKNG